MIRLILSCLFSAAPLAAQGQLLPSDLVGEDMFQAGTLIPLTEAIALVSKRFHGRALAATLRPPRPEEFALGAALIYDLRWLTPADALLRIRIDAGSGRIVDIAGAGLTEARRKEHR